MVNMDSQQGGTYVNTTIKGFSGCIAARNGTVRAPIDSESTDTESSTGDVLGLDTSARDLGGHDPILGVRGWASEQAKQGRYNIMSAIEDTQAGREGETYFARRVRA